MSSGTLYLGENAVSPSVTSVSVKYSAGENIKISDDLVISATDTKYTAGNNITIDDENKIHAKEYKSGNNIEVSEDGTINSTALALPDPTGKELSVLMTDGVNASWKKQATFNLLDRKESDYLLNDIRWLRADTFSWQSGDLYPTVYEHLVEDFEKAEGEKWYAFQIYGGTPEVPTPDGGTDCTSVLWSKTSTPAVGDTVYYSSWEGRIPIDTIASMDSDFITLTGGIQLYTSRFEEYICANLDIIGGVHIWYWKSPDGHKIINPYHIKKYDATNKYGSKIQSEHLEKLFQSTGSADYFILDKTNKRFKLPRKHKRKIVHTYRNGKHWYNLYSDGYVEQGNHLYKGSSVAGTHVITFLIPFADTNYNVFTSLLHNSAGGSPGDDSEVYPQRTPESFSLSIKAGWHGYAWEAKGYAAKGIVGSHICNFEYYYVGEFNKTSIEQVASITAETLNSKIDVPANVSQDDIDFVIEWQKPTDENNHTWYRKYKSGWVEQGGAKCASNTEIVFPVPMADNNYTTCAIANFASGITQAMAIQVINNRTTTSMLVASFSVGGYTVDWQVSGMAA